MAKSNEEYWRDRALELEEKWHTKSKETIERELAAYYRQSLQHIQRDIEALYGTFAKDNQLSMTDAKKLLQGDEFRVWRMDIKEYLAQIDATGDPALLKELNTLAMRSRITRLDKLYSETLMELSKLAEKTGQSMDKFLTEAYKDGYYRNLFEIGKKAGLVSTPVKVDNKQAENVLRTPWSGKNYSERIWRNDARLAEIIKETVTQGIHRGSSLQKLSRQVADKMNVGINDAKRLVQTELNYVQNKSALDSIKEAGMNFFRIISTHDARTCARCGSKDGEEIPVGDASPGDTLPPFHARCRCTIAASFGDGKVQKGRRIARDENGRNIRIPADMKYGDWKAVYIDKTKTLASWEKSLANVAENGKIRARGVGELEQARKKDHKFAITDEAINRIPFVKTPMMSEEQGLMLREMHQELLKVAKNENNGDEVALISTERFKRPYVKVFGTQNSVNYTEDINVRALKRESYALELVMAHNHPTTKGFSFADIAIFVVDEYLSILSAVTNQGQAYVMQKMTKFDYYAARELIDKLIDKYELLQYPKDEERQISAAREFMKQARKVGIWHEASK